MSVFWQSVLAVLAAVGLYSLLRTAYELIFCRVLRQRGAAELILHGNGARPEACRLIAAAFYVRRNILPGLVIRFQETGDGAVDDRILRWEEQKRITYLR